MLSACLLLAVSGLDSNTLRDFVRKPDASFAWRRQGAELRLTSQTWQGAPWKHSITLAQPDELRKTDTAILVVTGDRVDRADGPFAQRLADASGLQVATLFDIPNQPIGGMREDDLIAHTFGKFLETGDPKWPLLLPMTKSVRAAMDALQADNPKLKKFIITGGSKRGWTTWLAGGMQDSRVAGIAPMVFDFLDFKAQLKHQVALWGKPSEMLGDYTERGLDKLIEQPIARQLIALVDPISYRNQLKVPVLIVLGSNDRYWATDALSLYWDRVPGPKYVRIVPNVGHNLGDGRLAAESIGFFARGVSGTLPAAMQRAFRNGTLKSQTGAYWSAQRMNDLDFRDAEWRPIKRRGGNIAEFFEYIYKLDGRTFSFTTPVSIKRKR
jgi:PhoPQ-activated pathogenicity-related protein